MFCFSSSRNAQKKQSEIPSIPCSSFSSFYLKKIHLLFWQHKSENTNGFLWRQQLKKSLHFDFKSRQSKRLASRFITAMKCQISPSAHHNTHHRALRHQKPPAKIINQWRRDVMATNKVFTVYNLLFTKPIHRMLKPHNHLYTRIIG